MAGGAKSARNATTPPSIGAILRNRLVLDRVIGLTPHLGLTGRIISQFTTTESDGRHRQQQELRWPSNSLARASAIKWRDAPPHRAFSPSRAAVRADPFHAVCRVR